MDIMGWEKQWKVIHDSVPAQRIGDFEIEKNLKNISLIEHSGYKIIWMSVDGNEWCLYRSLPELVCGKVLIAGLGLGFDLLNVVDRDCVDEVVLVEKRQVIIDLVWPYIPHSKTTLVHQDVSEYLRDTKERFDVIYFDIFPGGHESQPDLAKQLVEVADSKLNPNGQVILWSEEVGE